MFHSRHASLLVADRDVMEHKIQEAIRWRIDLFGLWRRFSELIMVEDDNIVICKAFSVSQCHDKREELHTSLLF